MQSMLNIEYCCSLLRFYANWTNEGTSKQMESPLQCQLRRWPESEYKIRHYIEVLNCFWKE